MLEEEEMKAPTAHTQGGPLMPRWGLRHTAKLSALCPRTLQAFQRSCVRPVSGCFVTDVPDSCSKEGGSISTRRGAELGVG